MKTKKIEELSKLVLKHKSLYYQGMPEISDSEYDKLEEELKSLDPDNYALNLVGSLVTNQNKIQHTKKMLSLNKTYDVKDLSTWIGNNDVIGMFKIDGVSCSLLYDGGKLYLGKTRGDGVYGEDITTKVLWISDIPKTIELRDATEIRGEIFCDEVNFLALADEMERRKLDRPSNPRNIVAGLMGRKDHLDLAKYLSFFAYDLLDDKMNFEFEEEKLKKINIFGFKVPEHKKIKCGQDIQGFLNQVLEFMNEGTFAIDGAVFIYDNILSHDELGETNHHPKYKMAFKWEGESKVSKINSIIWQVSRNGVLTPVADIEPVILSGAEISRVTLHNFGVVKNNHLKKGDYIKIIRSGEVIPKFLSVEKSSDEEFSYPTTCPSCGEKIKEIDIRLICENDLCGDKNKESILHFVKNIGIDDLSDKRLVSLIEKKLVKEVDDLYKLKVEDFLTLEKTKEKLANKIISSIEKTKQVGIVPFLTALGITGGGEGKCEKIVNSGYENIEKVLSLTFDNLVQVDSFAEKSAEEFLKSLNSKRNLINKLIKLGFEIEPAISIGQTGKLKDNKFCITGTLSVKRSDLEKSIKSQGGIIQSSVSKNTDFLVTNEKESTSSKFKMAKKLSIPIITEEDLIKLLNN